MKKNIISITLIIMLVLVATSCGIHVKVNNDVQSENKTTHDVEYKEEVTNTLTIKINDKEFIINLENNKTALEFAEMLPLSLSMTELNGNEKYVYLDETLTTDSYNPKHIEAGDVMLYGNNCLVIFYKSFDTSYSYTKIGHIDNLPDLGSENVLIEIKD